MNVLIVAMAMNAGGAETHVLTLTRALMRRGDSVTVVSAGGKLAAAAARDGARILTLPLNNNSPLAIGRAVIGLARLCRGEHFDVAHAHGRIPALACHIARKFCRRVPPTVVTVHGIYDKRARGAAFSWWGVRTIAVSNDIADYTSRTYEVPRERIDVIENGVEIPAGGAEYNADQFRILSTCRQDNDSCAAALALCTVMPALCRKYPNLSPQLTIVGGGEKLGDIRARAEAACCEIGRSAIECRGEAEEAAALCRDADLFVGTARSALEAMAAGTPTLLFGDAGARGLADSAVLAAAQEDNLTCRLAPRQNSCEEFLLSELCRFAELDAAGRESLGAAGRKIAFEKYNINETAERTAAVLCDAAQSERCGQMICGYYGAGNMGDDASLAAIVEAMRSRDPQLPLTVLTRGECTSVLPRGVDYLPAADLWRVMRKMRECRDFLLGGGSLLQNSTSLRSLVFYAFITRAAHFCGCRVTILGGVGPLHGTVARQTASRAVRVADRIYARDVVSARIFAELGVNADRISVIRDPAYSTRAAKGAGNAIKYIPEGRYIVVCPRSVRGLWHEGMRRGGREFESKLFSEIERAVSEATVCGDVTVLFAAFSPQDDSVCAAMAKSAKTAAAIVPSCSLTAGEMITLMAGSDRVIAMRLHAAIFAAVANVPCTVIEYDPKFRALDTAEEKSIDNRS